MTIVGLAQKYLENNLEIHEEQAKAIILEVKEIKGLGKALDIILYDGTLNVNDSIVIGGLDGAIVTKVKAIFAPSNMGELRDKKTKFDSSKKITAAAGVRIGANDIENVVAGMPLLSVTKETEEQAKEEVQKEIEEVTLQTDNEGIVIKADSLGSLEALIVLLHEKNIKIASASIGNINKKDVATADSNYEKDIFNGIILGFNVGCEIQTGKISVLTSQVIYRLIDEFETWKSNKEKELEQKKLDNLVRPCKIQLLKNYIFRQSNPAVIGVEVIAGKLKPGMPLMKDGKVIAHVKALQEDKESLTELEEGKQAALSMDNIVIGRTLMGDEILYSAVPDRDFKIMKEFKRALTQKEIEVIKEIATIMRKENPVWGI
jgi:translation initiation factor 5B